MATVIAIDLITSSMRLIGAIATGETPSAEESNDALDVLNDILDGWATENLALYRNENNAYALVPNQQTYTIGVGGDFVATRPVTIEGAYVTYNTLDFPLRLLNTDQWNGITLKNFAAPIPNALYYVAEYPLGKIHLWPKPSMPIPITLSVNMQFVPIATVSDTLAVPPGYRKALRYILAVELASEYGTKAPDTVQRIAAEALGNIKAANRQMPVAVYDSSLTGAGGTGLAGFLGGY